MFKDLYKKKKVLVTGHTGFKGSWLSLWLKALGAQIIGYSLEPPSRPNNFEACGLQQQVIHIYGDVRDYEHLLAVFKEHKPDIVFHLAAQPLVRLSYKNPILTYETNVMGTVNLLEAVRATDSVRVLVNVTSDKCYENREWVWGYRENDPVGGYDPYSSSKGCAELVTAAYRQSFFSPERYEDHGVALSSVRAGNVIGGGDWGADRLIPDCVTAISENRPVLVRNPNAIRPWQHVLDPLYGYLLLGAFMVQSGADYASAWNFGPSDSEVLTVEEVVKRFIQYWGKGTFARSPNPPFRESPLSAISDSPASLHEAHLLKLDCSKAHNLLGWIPLYRIEQALKETAEWYRLFYSGAGKEEIYQENRRQILEYMENLR